MAVQTVYLSKLNTLGFGIETVAPGTSVSSAGSLMSSGAYTLRVFEVQVSPEIQRTAREYATGYFSPFIPIAGERKGTVTFKMHLSPNEEPADDTNPDIADPLLCCGFLGTSYAGTGVGFTPQSGKNTTATIEVPILTEGTSASQIQFAMKLVGCVGGFTLTAPALGEPLVVEFSFEGRMAEMIDISNGNIVHGTKTSTLLPPAMMNASEITWGGVTQCFSAMTLTVETTKAMFKCGGIDGVIERGLIAGRKITLEIDPYLRSIADQDIWAALKQSGGDTGAKAFSLALGDISISIPKAVVTNAYGLTDKEGIVGNPLTLEATRDGTTDDTELELLYGTKV